MGPESAILVALALIFGGYMAWNIGANDVANAMGTSVGSGALTLRRAVIIAAIMEFTGAFLIGPHVSETVRKGIIDPNLFASEPIVLALGMLASLLAAGMWLQLASYFGWPVSTTHSIVGAIVGFGIAYGGMEVIAWGEVGKIAASWIVSPAISGCIAFFLFRIILVQVFYKPDPVAAAKRIAPLLVFIVLATMTLVLFLKGLKPFLKDNFGVSPLETVPLMIGLTTALVGGGIGALVARRLVRRIGPADPDTSVQARDLYLLRSLSKAIMHLRRVRNTSGDDLRKSADEVLQDTKKMQSTLRARTRSAAGRSEFGQVERIFVYLQIISACFVALAHGANDVANAIGPLSVTFEIALTMEVPTAPRVSLLMLAIGGGGIVLGLATWGWRVMRTVGRKITELTPSRGFCAEFAAALTILVASVYKLPISTTHTLVGAVLGVGLARGIGALNLTTIRDIAISWVITIPAGAAIAVVIFYCLRFAFGA